MIILSNKARHASMYVNMLRWLLTLPLAFVGYVVAILAAITLSSLLTRFCPSESLVSGMCTASWYWAAELAAFSVASAIGAALFVGLPALVAPKQRLHVALVALLAGSFYAAWFVLQVGSSFVTPAISAVASGMYTTWLFKARNKNAV